MPSELVPLARAPSAHQQKDLKSDKERLKGVALGSRQEGWWGDGAGSTRTISDLGGGTSGGGEADEGWSLNLSVLLAERPWATFQASLGLHFSFPKRSQQ